MNMTLQTITYWRWRDNNRDFLGYEGQGIEGDFSFNISYWQDRQSIKNWRDNAEHIAAQKKGKDKWYKWFQVRIAKVEQAYSFSLEQSVELR